MSNPHPFFYFPELSSWVPLCIQTPCACVYTDKITLENCIIRTWTCDISLLFLWSFPSLPYPYGGRKAGRSLCTSPLPLPTSLLGSPGIRTTERLCWYRRKQASKQARKERRVFRWPTRAFSPTMHLPQNWLQKGQYQIDISHTKDYPELTSGRKWKPVITPRTLRRSLGNPLSTEAENNASAT